KIRSSVNNLLQQTLCRLPAFPGKLRLARLLLRKLNRTAVLKDRFGFWYEVPDLREPIAFHLFVNGRYEPQVQDLLLRILRPGDVFIDVGANIGTFTIPLADRVSARGK